MSEPDPIEADKALLEKLAERLLALIRERVLDLASDFKTDDSLYDAGLDSMAIMQLLLVVEEEFGISIAVESVSKENFSSAVRLSRLIHEKCGSERVEVKNIETTSTTPLDVEPLDENKTTGVEGFQSQTMRGADYFVMSFDRLSRKTGQGGHKAHSILVLDKLPDVTRLKDALCRAAELYPMLNAQLQKQRLFGAPSWVPARRNPAPSLDLYSEASSAGKLLDDGAEQFSDAHKLMERITNSPMPEMQKDVWQKARFSLLELRDGSAVLIFSWSHLMIDGVGAELFLKELDHIFHGEKRELTPALEGADAAQEKSVSTAWQRTGPMIDFFRKLAKEPITCLGPEKPCAGQTHFLVHTLTSEQTARANARCAALCGDLVTMPFYLAAAMRAHGAVFAHRRQTPQTQVCAVPIQTRRKGQPGPIFLNHITIFFGQLSREEEASIEQATAALLKQHQHFLKHRLGDSFNDLMFLMSYIPTSLYMAFMKMQTRGPISTLFHSHTGEFASGLNTFCGASITNAFHVPGIGTPPGTGIFCNEKNGRLIVTMCWHENALNEAERGIMMNHFLKDLDAQ